MVLPCFKSHYSLGRSILTLEKEGTSQENGPDSIIDLAVKNGIKDVILIEDGMSSFLEAYTNCKAAKLNLIFGLRITVCENALEKGEETLDKTSKIVIFIKNSEGYKDLVKIFSFAAREDIMYYVPRIDYAHLKKMWTDNLLLVIPFYDSFLFQNLLTFKQCVPDFSFTSPVFFLEHNELPFDSILREQVEIYCHHNKYQTQEAQSIYYAAKSDFPAFLTFKCIHDRTLIEKPEIEHLTSNTFCLESWKNFNPKP
jgi:DNA polymerase III alpha subunit